LFVVALAVIVATFTPIQGYGVGVVGALPQGLPAIRPPSVRLRDVDGVVPLACACFLLSYIESVSAGRALAAAHRDEIDPRRELLGLGAANLAAAFAQGFPVAGGLSQSAVNDKAGARSPLALVFASAVLGLCLSFLTGLLKNLPSVVLAAVVLVAVRGLVDIPALVRLRRVSRSEFGVALLAFAGVLLLGILNGVMLAAVASLLLVVAAAARPPVAFLGRIPGTNRFSDLARHPENEQVPGVLVFRVEAAILYFNADHVRRVVRDKVRETPGLRFVVCDLSNSPRVDVAGARMLAALHRELSESGVALRLAEARSRVRDLLRSDGLEARVGYFGRRLSIAAVVEEIERTGDPGTPPSEDATPGPDRVVATRTGQTLETKP
jgi:MFS superfamily sulfate permease-like transporter